MYKNNACINADGCKKPTTFVYIEKSGKYEANLQHS